MTQDQYCLWNFYEIINGRLWVHTNKFWWYLWVIGWKILLCNTFLQKIPLLNRIIDLLPTKYSGTIVLNKFYCFIKERIPKFSLWTYILNVCTDWHRAWFFGPILYYRLLFDGQMLFFYLLYLISKGSFQHRNLSTDIFLSLLQFCC